MPMRLAQVWPTGNDVRICGVAAATIVAWLDDAASATTA